MGFIKALGQPAAKATTKFPGADAGRATWREIFGQGEQDKERQPKPISRQSIAGGPRPNDGYGRSISGSDAATKRLIQAMRSMAPGGWSDDRYAQSRHFHSLPYVAIHRKCTQLQQAEFQVFKKDPSHPDGKRPVTEDDPPEPGFGLTKPYDLVKLLKRPNRQDSFGAMMYRCFPAGTQVKLVNGDYKNIEDIQLLDEVVTAEGNRSKVTKCFVQPYTGNMVRLKLWGHSHLLMTPNHEVLTERGYIPAGELTKDDWVSLPRYEPERCKFLQTADHIQGETVKTKEWHADRSYGRESRVAPSTGGVPWATHKRVPDAIELTYGFGRILGLYLAEGHPQSTSLVWSFSTEEVELIADLRKLLLDELGLESRTQVVNKWGSVTQVVVNGALWRRLFLSLCGKGSWAKRIHPDLLGGSDRFLEGLYSGWLDGDGYSKDGKSFQGTTVSHDLALGMFDIANRLGYRPAIRKQKAKIGDSIHGIPVKSRRSSWNVFATSPGDNYRVKQEEKVMWRRVRSIDLEPYSGNVFNFEVQGDNSYIAESIGVHNCLQQKDLTGMALMWMVPNQLGVPFEMYVIPTCIAIPQPAINPDYPDGYWRIQPIYPYGPFSSYPTPTTAVGAPIPAQWMLRFVYPHPILRYDGFSPLTGVNLQTDEIESIDTARFNRMRRQYGMSATLDMTGLEGQEGLSEAEIDRIRAELENTFEGPQNTGKIFIPPPGTEMKPYEYNAELGYHDDWDQLASFLLGGGFGITKPAAGMVEDSSYSTLYATLQQLYIITLQPEADSIAAEFTHHLAPFFGTDLIVEIRCKRVNDHEISFGKVDKLTTLKGMPKSVIRAALKLMDMPVDEDLVEELSVQEQPMMPGAGPGMEGMAGAQGEEGEKPQAPNVAPEQDEEPEAVTQSRPKPSPMQSRGSLGPRKSLTETMSRKNLFKALMAPHTNGNGHHLNGHSK